MKALNAVILCMLIQFTTFAIPVNSYTVEPVLGDHPFCPSKAVAQDRWSLITGRAKIMFHRCVHFTHSQAVGLSETGTSISYWIEEQAIYLHNSILKRNSSDL